ncbi:MAG: hypothetical protein IPM06_17540 [Rhizobiales bacterium]|nr:hypothetical protein [Hyphomicrobiales bacterium]
MSKLNDKFTGTPEADETEAQRVARLRIKAETQAAQEFDEDAVYAKFLAEARDKRMKVLSGDDVELPTDTRGFPLDYDKIEIFRGQNKQDLPQVPLSLGPVYQKSLAAGEVIVPHAFVEGRLALCVEDITIQSQGGYVTRPVQRFPYSFKSKATPEEYKAFQEKEKEQQLRETAQAA